MSGEKLAIIRSVLGEFRTHGPEYIFQCPKCDHHKKKLSVNLEKNAFKCWVCDFSGKDIFYLVKRYGTRKDKEDYSALTDIIDYDLYDKLFLGKESEEEHRVASLNLPKEYESLSNEKISPRAQMAKEYLYGRGLTDEDILTWKVGFCSRGYYSGRVVVPSFNENGELDYFVARTINGNNNFKYLNPKASKDVIFNELMIDWSEDVVLVEGVFDAFKAPNSIPLLGSAVHEGSKLFKKIVSEKANIFLALDDDAELKSLKIISSLLQYGVNLYRVDLGDYNDVGEMSKKKFLIKKNEAKFIESRDYLLYRALNF